MGVVWERGEALGIPEGGHKFNTPLPDTFNELEQMLMRGCEKGLMLAWMSRWNVREKELPVLESNFGSGDKSAPLQAIFRCLAYDVPIPEWAKAAYISTCAAISDGDIVSWEQAFGRLHPKGVHLSTMKKHDRLRRLIFADVSKAIASGASVDESLFEEIGRRHGAGKTLAAELYYKEKKWHDEF